MSRRFLPSISLFAIGAALALFSATAAAQTPVPPGSYLEFRDPVTGKTWTPENVSKDGQPVPYEDRAFEPRDQTAGAAQIVVQRPQVRVLGTVPITSGAGTNVPIVRLEVSLLQADPGNRWRTILYVTNNSGAMIQPVVFCGFSNAGNVVEETRVNVAAAGPGERLGMAVRGPLTTIHVDRVDCRVLSPV